VRDADQLIAGALRDIAAEAGLPGQVADAAWRAGRRRRLAALAASAASVAAAITLALVVVLSLTTAPGPAASVSGTETITGQVSGAAAAANDPTISLTFHGLVNATGSWTVPSTNDTHQVTTFRTTAGNLTINATLLNPNGRAQYVGAPCRYGYTTRVAYTVDGAKSTGKFAGASGSGRAAVTSSVEVPKQAGTPYCEDPYNYRTQPLNSTGKFAFTGAGPLTVRTSS
jgi:hypothetical protein